LLKDSRYYVPPNQVASYSEKGKGPKPGFTVITPAEPSARGAQLSLLFLPLGSETMRVVFDYLSKNGVIGDEREPDVIRLAPAPLYNTLRDCEHAAEILEDALAFIAQNYRSSL